MSPHVTRRMLTTATISAAFWAPVARAQSSAAARNALPDSSPAAGQAALHALETRHGGRLGVCAVEPHSGRRLAYRAEERFPMCSTHKLLTVAAVLHMRDQGLVKLDERIAYGEADLLGYAPITRKNVAQGSMTLGALCAAAIDWSDNTAENLLLKTIGGPRGWTAYARSIGDTVSRLDRNEPSLNSAIPGDPRDTTTPAAMTDDLGAVLLGGALSGPTRRQLTEWLLDSQIDGTLLHAGLPAGWSIGDKSGSGDQGTRNDIGIVFPPKASPILVAVYYTGSTVPLASREAVIADVGTIIGRVFGPR
jgi:beta-lactamase class A